MIFTEYIMREVCVLAVVNSVFRTGVLMRKTRNGFWRIGREVGGLTTALEQTPVECPVWLESDDPDEFLEDRVPRM